jgi:hypothetical protein
MLRLLCDTNQMAFGSSSALLAILNHLPSINTAFTYGVTSEILSTSKLIHNFLKTNNKDNEKVKKNLDLTQYDAVLVISNLTNVNWYLDSNIPVFYIDLHSWWHPNTSHRIKNEAAIYFTESFFEENPSIGKNIIKTGPIITLKKVEKPKKKQVLINLGGGTNKWIEPGINSNYAIIILDIISRIQSEFDGYKIIIAAGKAAMKQIKEQNLFDNFIASTFSQEEYLNILTESEILISSPGLNAIFEGIYYGNKVIMLPPQNASQIIQLKYYEKFGLIKKGLNLDTFFTFPRFKEIKNIDEKELTIMVLNALKILELATELKNKMASHIIKQLKFTYTTDYKKTLTLAKSTLGIPGANDVSKYIQKSKNYFVNTTVVIPTAALRLDLLEIAINSVLNNIILPKQIIISVDNNEPGYKTIQEQYSKYNFVTVIHNIKRKGVSGTRNYCLNFITTRFISFLDDDDYWDCSYLENVFTGESFDIALVGFKKKKNNRITEEKLPPIKLKPELFFVKNPGIRGSNINIKKTLFEKMNGFNEKLLAFNDMDFGARLSEQKEIKYKSIQKHLVIFNSHSGKRISTPGCKENRQGIQKFLEIYKHKMSRQELIEFRNRALTIWGIDAF